MDEDFLTDRRKTERNTGICDFQIRKNFILIMTLLKL